MTKKTKQKQSRSWKTARDAGRVYTLAKIKELRRDNREPRRPYIYTTTRRDRRTGRARDVLVLIKRDGSRLVRVADDKRVRPPKPISREDAERAFIEHALRKNLDRKHRAKTTFPEPNDRWLKNIRRYDVEGIDTPTRREKMAPKITKPSGPLVQIPEKQVRVTPELLQKYASIIPKYIRSASAGQVDTILDTLGKNGQELIAILRAIHYRRPTYLLTRGQRMTRNDQRAELFEIRSALWRAYYRSRFENARDGILKSGNFGQARKILDKNEDIIDNLMHDNEIKKHLSELLKKQVLSMNDLQQIQKLLRENLELAKLFRNDPDFVKHGKSLIERERESQERRS